MDPDEVARRVHQRAEARATDIEAALTQQAATNRRNLHAYIEQIRTSIPALAANDPGPPPPSFHLPLIPPTMPYLAPLTIPPSLTPGGLLRRERVNAERPTAGWMLLTWNGQVQVGHNYEPRSRTKGLYMLVDGWFAIADREKYAPSTVVENTATDENVLDLILSPDRRNVLNSKLGWHGEFVKHTTEVFRAAGLTPPSPPDVRPTGPPYHH